MDTMQQLTVLAVLSLYCTSLTSGTGDCHPEGPENCTIVKWQYSAWSRTVCSWSLGRDFDLMTRSNEWLYWFVGLVPGSKEGNLTSRRACSTGGQTYCLRFWYKFEQNNTIGLSVSIQYDRNNEAESPLWIMSASDGWDSATVPISTDRSFTVVFKAKRRTAHISSSAMVFIDLISYSKSSCPSGLYQSNAQPTKTTTSTTTNIFSTTAAASTKVTRKDIASETIRSNNSREDVKHTVTTTEGTLSTTLLSRQVGSESPLGKVGVIVGAVVAVVVFFSIILVLVVVLRRKQRNSKHQCIESRHQREQPEPDKIPDTPRTDNENNTETATGTGQEDYGAHNPDNGVYIDLDAPTTDDSTREDYGAHKAAPPDGQREVSDGAGPEPAAANYDRLDFSDAEKDIRVYGGLHVYTNTCQATPKRELYETLSEQRNNHIYSEALKRI